MTHFRRNMTKNKYDHIHYTLQFLPPSFHRIHHRRLHTACRYGGLLRADDVTSERATASLADAVAFLNRRRRKTKKISPKSFSNR